MSNARENRDHIQNALQAISHSQGQPSANGDDLRIYTTDEGDKIDTTARVVPSVAYPAT
ncbi:hypothetical protein OY671_006837, partial [Metschnikowia pulcherrima]